MDVSFHGCRPFPNDSFSSPTERFSRTPSQRLSPRLNVYPCRVRAHRSRRRCRLHEDFEPRSPYIIPSAVFFFVFYCHGYDFLSERVSLPKFLPSPVPYFLAVEIGRRRDRLRINPAGVWPTRVSFFLRSTLFALGRCFDDWLNEHTRSPDYTRFRFDEYVHTYIYIFIDVVIVTTF